MKKSLVAVTLSILFCSKAYAQNLCPTINASSVERWPIAEESINKQNANLAVEELKVLVSESENEGMYFAKKYANTLECQVENALTTVKLYSLRVDALKNKKSKYGNMYIERFCKILEESTLCH